MTIDCECPRCGRLHRDLLAGKPPGALSHEDFCRLSRAFNTVAELGNHQDYHINEWLKKQIAAFSVRS